MRARWIATVLLAALVTGCSRPEPPDPEPARPVELVLNLPVDAFDRNVVDEVIEAYESKNPNVRVKVAEGEPPGPMSEPRLPEGADIVWVVQQSTAALIEAGMLRDLSALELPEFDPLLSDYLSAVSMHEGQRYFVPVHFEPGRILVNRVAFQDAGVPLPTADWTYADLEETLRALKAAGKESNLGALVLMGMVVEAHGGDYYDPEAGKWRFNTPANRQAFTYLRRLVQDGLVADAIGLSGRLGGPKGAALHMTADSRPMPDYFAVPFPRGPAGVSTKFVAHFGLAVSAESAHPELAMAFVQELAGSELSNAALARAGMRPLYQHPEAVSVWREQIGDGEADAFDRALSGLHTKKGPEAPFSFQDDLRRIYKGEADMEQVFTDLESRLNQ